MTIGMILDIVVIVLLVPTIVYAFMQAVGMVNDHAVTCFRHPEYRKKK